MGLDMFLRGHKYLWKQHDKPEADIKEDGYLLKERILELGYWRKHSNLHGYIVHNFAEGVDECQPIDLSNDNIREIIDAIKNANLPHTEGFFFGESAMTAEEKEDDIKILSEALEWAEDKQDGVSKSIVYQASW